MHWRAGVPGWLGRRSYDLEMSEQPVAQNVISGIEAAWPGLDLARRNPLTRKILQRGVVTSQKTLGGAADRPGISYDGWVWGKDFQRLALRNGRRWS